jgi:YD repeat-containing protein
MTADASSMPQDPDFTEDQKQYLEGFIAGIAKKHGIGVPNGAAAGEPAPGASDQDGQLIAANDNSASMQAPTAAASYSTSYSYDALNRPLSAVWTPVVVQTTPTASSSSFAFTYDATNRRIGQTATDNGWWNYPTTAGSIAYTSNNLNQYSAVGAVTPTYDGNGNLTYDGTYTYCYDAESRLTGIIGAGTCASPTTTVASYAYDAQGRRKTKTVGGTTTAYVTDADNREVLEYNGTSGSGALLRWYSFGQGPDAALNQMNVSGTATRATLIPDIQGSLIGALDAASGTLSKTGYQPFGQNPGLTTSAPPGFYYTGRRLDPETAGSTAQPSGLYYYRARMYSPTWGRFWQQIRSATPAAAISTPMSGMTRSTTPTRWAFTPCS